MILPFASVIKLLLPRWFGLDGILYAGPIADACAGLVVAAFATREVRKLNRWIAQDATSGERAP